MTGYVMAFSPCFCCARPFAYNPNLVPSMRVEGVREPVCENCMRIVNAKRKEAGLEPHPIMEGAYEAVAEGEL